MTDSFANIPKDAKIRVLPHDLDYLVVPLDIAKSLTEYLSDCPICAMKVCTLCGANGHTPANCPWNGRTR